MSEWNFFTNYGHVIFLLFENPRITNREIAQKVGITERATQNIIHDLEKDGFIKIKKEGRNNIYKVNGKKKLKHELEKKCKIEDLAKIILQNKES